MSSSKYLIVFDTNILYIPYKERADFTTFHFNSTFKNVLDKVEELDLYDHIRVGVPTVVWEEMINQKYEAYETKIKDIQQKNNKFQFPFHKFSQEKEEMDYLEYLREQVKQYKENLSKRQVKVIDLNLPGNDRFDSIVKRAFEKRPPFEGIEGNSDKGFKDALLWESILEYKSVNTDENIILYSNDKLFCEELVNEFEREFEGSNILICGKNQESKLIKELEEIALKIDEFSYIEDTDDELDHIKTWILSEDFSQQFLKFEDQLEEVNKYVTLNRVTIEEVFDIEEYDTENEMIKDIRVNLSIKFVFMILGKTEAYEKYDVVVYANIFDETLFAIDDIEIEREGDEVE